MDTIEITKTFKINSNGDCSRCDCRCFENDEICLAFDSKVKWYASSGYKQCKSCKEFLNKVNKDKK